MKLGKAMVVVGKLLLGVVFAFLGMRIVMFISSHLPISLPGGPIWLLSGIICFLLPWMIWRPKRRALPANERNTESQPGLIDTAEVTRGMTPVLTEILDLPLPRIPKDEAVQDELQDFLTLVAEAVHLYQSTDVVIVPREAILGPPNETLTPGFTDAGQSLFVWSRVSHERTRLRVELRFAERVAKGWERSNRCTNWAYEQSMAQYHREVDIRRSHDSSFSSDEQVLNLPFAIVASRSLKKKFEHLDPRKAEEASALRNLFLRSVSEAYERLRTKARESSGSIGLVADPSFQNRSRPQTEESDEISL